VRAVADVVGADFPVLGRRRDPLVEAPQLLGAYIAAAGILEDRKGSPFRSARGPNGSVSSDKAMSRRDAWRMIGRGAKAAGITAPICNHTVRATGITAYLSNGGALEHAQEMAAHESSRTTKLCHRTTERLIQDEVGEDQVLIALLAVLRWGPALNRAEDRHEPSSSSMSTRFPVLAANRTHSNQCLYFSP
jgi:hypothetical protein